ncbi:hypothetical protein [Pseudomonas sp. CAM1A]|uniref:hypothetical protein n=1 Tax=Pseudomonas sp. CAM1A TaxID=3231717 RepID=UPI0039C6712F
MPALYVTFTLLLFLLCLCFDGILMGVDGHMPALQILLMGPWGIAMGLYQWFANPLLGLALLAHRRFRRLALGAGVIALGLALSCLGIERVPDNRSYNFLPLTGFGAGYYLWTLAILLFCLGQAWWCRKVRSARDVPGWRWFDGVLITVLAATIYAGTQMPSLRVQPISADELPEQAATR